MLIPAILLVPLLVVGVAAPPSSPLAVATNFNQPVTTEIAPGGSGWVASPSLPANARSITVTVQAPPAAPNWGAFKTVLATLSNRNRLLACVAVGDRIYSGEADVQPQLWGQYTPPPPNEPNGFVAAAFMRACFQMVAELTAPRTTTRSTQMASAPCSSIILQAPVSLSKNAEGYLVSVSGAVAPARRTALRVRCTSTASGLTLSLRTRSKKKTLRQVVGERLTLGFMSPTTATESLPLTLRYQQPR